MGRCLATLFTDEIFNQVAYRARSRDDLLAGIDEFLDAVTVLPPAAWDPATRIDPPQGKPCQKSRSAPVGELEDVDSEEERERERELTGLKRTGK